MRAHLPDVFISYGQQDRDRVRPIAEALEEAGLDVWWDPDIPPGTEFRAEIGRALREATAVIVVWSQYSVTRHFVLDEAGDALQRGVLFPVLIDVVDIPLGFRQIQTVDLTKWRGKNDDAAFRSLIDAVEHITKARTQGGEASAGGTEGTAQSLFGDRRFSITGVGARLRLLGRAALLGLAAAAGAAVSTFVSLQTSESLFYGVRNSDLFESVFWEGGASIPFLTAALISTFIGACAFFLALLARGLTFWADGVFGVKSLALTSRSFLAVVLTALIVASPAERHWRLAPNLFGNSVTSAAFSPNGAKVVTGFENGSVQIWDAATGAKKRRLRGHLDAITSAVFSPDGSRIVTTSRDRTVRLWDPETGEQLRNPIDGYDFGVNSAAFSPNGSRFITGSCDVAEWTSCDGTARLWSTATGEALGAVASYDDLITSAAFSSDGARIVTASLNGTARIWDAATHREIGSFTDFRARSIVPAGVSLDGTRIVTVSYNGTAEIWDTRTGENLRSIGEHQGGVNTASFSPDGKYVVTAMGDKTAKIWNSLDGVKMATLSGHADSVTFSSFSPDGYRIITASRDGTSRLWATDSGKGLLALSVICPSVNIFPFVNLKCFTPAYRVNGAVIAAVMTNPLPLLLHGVGLLVVAFSASAAMRLPLRLLFASERLQWLRPTVFAAAVLYLLLVYAIRLPAESILVWLVLAVIATPVVAFIRLLLAWEFRGAFAERV